MKRGSAVIVVSVQLDSAISPTRDKELARVLIANEGGTETLGDYKCVSLRGRGKEQLDRRIVQRRGFVENHPRKAEHVLNLVAKALIKMGYGK
jgi:hypothetical protein